MIRPGGHAIHAQDQQSQSGNAALAEPATRAHDKGDQANGLLSPFLRARRIAAVRPYLARGRVLDVGCGVGVIAEIVPADRYLGIDLDAASVEQARRAHPRHRFMTVDEFTSGAPGEQGPFDLIIGMAIVEHVAEPGAWLREMGGLLAPGGRLVLTTPHPRMQWAHELGARVGLFSKDAADEHNVLTDHKAMRELAGHAGLGFDEFRPFLFGCNQLFVLRRPA